MSLLIRPPAPKRVPPYFRTLYQCENPNCRYKNSFVRPERKTCPRCFAHVTVLGVRLVPLKEKS